MNCDLCGKEAELFKTLVEGTQLTVCSNCGKYGKVLGRVRINVPEKKKEAPVQKKEEVIQLVASNFGRLLKSKRESLGMDQKEFAQKIAEKESVLHRLENGEVTPTLERAQELEKMLGLRLIEEIKDEPIATGKDKTVMTLGDFVKIKTRKN